MNGREYSWVQIQLGNLFSVYKITNKQNHKSTHKHIHTHTCYQKYDSLFCDVM